MKGLQIPSWVALALALAVAVGLVGCATYKAMPLDTHIDLPKEARLTVDPATLSAPSIRSHVFDPSDGLDIDEVAMLAVANNPQLKVSRDQAGEVHAQAFSSGLLPDPQVSLTRDTPTNGGPGNTSAFNLGISFNLASLMLRSSTRLAAAKEARKADLDLLWQEWQVASQARLIFVRMITLKKSKQILNRQRGLFETRFRHSHAAFEAGNRTLDAASADFAALQTVSQRLNELDRQILRVGHDLNALLGLDPEALITLTGDPEPTPLDNTKIEAELSGLASRRPDLLALQRGYEAEEARMRQAILMQFPPIGLGFSRARDTSALFTTGFALSLALPLFNRNQGGIAMETATRQRLYDEFHQRLTTAYAEVRQLLGDGQLIEAQLVEIRRSLENATQTASTAESAFTAGNLDEIGYVQLAAAAADKQIEALMLNETLMEQRIGLQTLLGGDLPADLSTERPQ